MTSVDLDEVVYRGLSCTTSFVEEALRVDVPCSTRFLGLRLGNSANRSNFGLKIVNVETYLVGGSTLIGL